MRHKHLSNFDGSLGRSLSIRIIRRFESLVRFLQLWQERPRVERVKALQTVENYLALRGGTTVSLVDTFAMPVTGADAGFT